MEKAHIERKPEWLKVKSNEGEENQAVMSLMRQLSLHTVCEEAGCPNCGECFNRKTATFMILGNVCTRNCRFCNVSKGRPLPVDSYEPMHIADAVEKLNLRHVVITSVTRDDLPDGGAGHFAAVIKAIRERFCGQPPVIEVLIPDFLGDEKSLKKVLDAKPDILNHNIETVPRLYPRVRPMAIYSRSLALLKNAAKISPSVVTKSGIMAGLGETFEEMEKTMRDLRSHGCRLLTIGQYLAPSANHYPVAEYVTPETFDMYKETALNLGFDYVASAPLVRSSYMAEEAYQKMRAGGKDDN